MPKKKSNFNQIRLNFETKFGPTSTRAHNDEIKFVSTIDSKPISPPFLLLQSLADYIKNEKESKEVSPDKNKKFSGGLSLEKTEWDDIIRKRGVYRLLDDKLRGYINDLEIEAVKIKALRDEESKKINFISRLSKKVKVKEEKNLDETDDNDEAAKEQEEKESREKRQT